MLSTTADYALRAVLLLGGTYGNRPLPADEIADATGAPRNYLAKTLNILAKAGVVRSERGPAGGFSLAIAPRELPLARIIDLFDAPKPHSRCLLGNKPCDPAHPCTAHYRWSAILESHRSPFATTMVADLISNL